MKCLPPSTPITHFLTPPALPLPMVLGVGCLGRASLLLRWPSVTLGEFTISCLSNSGWEAHPKAASCLCSMPDPPECMKMSSHVPQRPQFCKVLSGSLQISFTWLKSTPFILPCCRSQGLRKHWQFFPQTSLHQPLASLSRCLSLVSSLIAANELMLQR